MRKGTGLHDLTRLPADGYLVFPISMGRIGNTQNPEECYGWLEFFEKKITMVGLDVIFLYSNGLYYNDEESVLEVRKRTNGQMLSHSNAVRNLIIKKRRYMPQAIHFVPRDYIILNAKNFQLYYGKLKKYDKENEEFHKFVCAAVREKKESEANINFVIEELAVIHIIRQREIEFPKTLVKKDNFRLMAYPGPPINADIQQWKRKILPQKERDKKTNPFYASMYDLENKKIYNYDELDIE